MLWANLLIRICLNCWKKWLLTIQLSALSYCQVTCIVLLPAVTCIVLLPAVTCIMLLPAVTCIVLLPAVTCIVLLPAVLEASQTSTPPECSSGCWGSNTSTPVSCCTAALLLSCCTAALLLTTATRSPVTSFWNHLQYNVTLCDFKTARPYLTWRMAYIWT